MAGLAIDGGLYVPASWPAFSAEQIQKFRGLSYSQLASRILSRFTGDCVPAETLDPLLEDAYRKFRHPAVAPLKQLDTSLYVMELFHGPTLSFKDFALQFLGRLFNYFLANRGRHCTIIGATSGDTGSAAIEAVRGLDAVTLYMLHPAGRVSAVQRRQMTTVLDGNIHNLAVDGTFDDCQNLIKAMFNDTEFRRKHTLSAVNSINWARIAAQVVYYFRAAVELGSPHRPVNFAVPTGNFGNVFAGYVAMKMGLPINRLIIGSNSNDILTRFFETGQMHQRGVNATISPSMDIQISSNFERYLFELLDRDSNRVCELMTRFAHNGKFEVSRELHRKAIDLFSAHRLSDKETSAEIKRIHEQTGELMDPHSVIAVAAARKLSETGVPTIVLGTAHPAKFGAAVGAASGTEVPLPQHLQAIMGREEKLERVANDLETIKGIIDRQNP